MLHVRFDPETMTRLALVWTDVGNVDSSTDYSRAADLLFSVIGKNSGEKTDWWLKTPMAKPSRRTRRNAKVAIVN